MRIGIHQPNYAPWCGYFTKMAHVDAFVFLDDAQMSSQSYIYRTQTRIGDKAQWLSVPTKFALGDPINSVTFGKDNWARKHVDTLRAVYGRASHFREVFPQIEAVYAEQGEKLCDFNIRLVGKIAEILGIKCKCYLSSELAPAGVSDDRLIDIVRKLGGDVYVSGKGGQNYQDPEKFATAGIGLEVRGYTPVPYAQGKADFMPGLSILDALFHIGGDARGLLRYPG